MKYFYFAALILCTPIAFAQKIDTNQNNGQINQFNENQISKTRIYAPTNVAAGSSETTVRNVTTPSIGSAFLTTSNNSDLCLGSASGGFSGMGFGFSGGGTLTDANCVLLKNSARLETMGMGKSAAIMFVTKTSDMMEAIFLGDPKIYLDITEQQVAVLQSKIAALEGAGKDSTSLRSELDAALLKLKAAQHRIGMQKP